MTSDATPIPGSSRLIPGSPRLIAGSIAGIIANPAAGKDIRRLVAHASVFNTEEKINIVRRVLLGLAATGVERVLYMPDSSHMIRRAGEGLGLALELSPVPGAYHAVAADSTTAAAAMAQAGVRVIVSLGGDGTNRAIAKGSSDVPIVPISTGTNNVFPVMVEGTVAGLAAGAIAGQWVNPSVIAAPCKRVEISVDGEPRDIALIDAVVMDGMFVGSRAIWDVDAVRQVVLTRAQPDAVGMSAVGGMVATVTPQDDFGLHLVLGPTGEAERNDKGKDDAAVRVIRAAIAPGLVRPVSLASVERLPFAAIVPLTGPALLALDGEREFSLARGQQAELVVARSGPPVVDIAACLNAARDAGLLRGE